MKNDKASLRKAIVEKLLNEEDEFTHQKRHFKTVNNELWKYDENKHVWKRDGKKYVNEYVTKNMENATQFDRNEVVATIKTLTYGEFYPTNNLIPEKFFLRRQDRDIPSYRYSFGMNLKALHY